MVAMYLPDYGSPRQLGAELGQAERQLRLAVPALKLELRDVQPPLPDDDGGFFYIAPPKRLKDSSVATIKDRRRDFMTSVTTAARELVRHWPRSSSVMARAR